MVILHTQHEVSMFSHYEDMKDDEKCKNWGGLGGKGSPSVLETSPFESVWITLWTLVSEN